MCYYYAKVLQMYKVFINEKKLSLTEKPDGTAKRLPYENTATFEIAADILENTSCPEINVYSDDIASMWDAFRKLYRNIEAAGGIVRNFRNEILFIFRLNRWDLPKGKMEKGESPEDAALREVSEETSLQHLTLKNFVNTMYHIYRERNGEKVLKMTHWYNMDFTGTEQPSPQTEEGISQVRWMSRAQIADEVFPTTFQNIRLIISESGMV